MAAPTLTVVGSSLPPPAWLVEESRALEPPAADERAYVLRDEAAALLDRLLVRVARGRGAIEVAIGEALAMLSVGDATLRLGYSSVGDYAREQLDVAPRTAQALVRLARALRDRPVLRAAVLAGEVSSRKAEAVLPLAIGDAEVAWTARAKAETVRALEAAARRARPDDAGSDPAEEESWERIDATLPAEGRAALVRALELAGEQLGAASPRWQRVEALCAEFLGAHPIEPHADDERCDVIPRQDAAALEEALELEFDRWRWLDALHASAPEDRGPGGPVSAPVPASASGERRGDVHRLDEDLRRLAAMRREWDALLGHLAMLVQGCGLWRDMKFATFGHYCSERLGMSGRAVQQRTALERRLHALPRLREAMNAGRVTYEKARLVASVADERSLDAWLTAAERATCVELRRLVDASDDAQMCARREITLRVPARVGALVRAAFRAARQAAGRWLTPGECLVRIAEHFVATWTPERRKATRARRVLARDGGLCQVPGCSRSADHAHHIRRRSAGGSDEAWNLVSLCAAHHLHGVHAGYLAVKGRAPDGLTWRLGPDVHAPVALATAVRRELAA